MLAQCAGLRLALAAVAVATAALLLLVGRRRASSFAYESHARLLLGAVALALIAVLAARDLPLPRGPDHVVALLDEHGRSAAKLRIYAEVLRAAAPGAGPARLIVGALGLGAERRPLHGSIRLSIAKGRRNWKLGDRMVFSSSLRRLSNLGNPGEFDFAGWNARRGIWVSAFVWDGDDIEPIASAAGWVTRARRAVSAAALRAEGRGAGLVAALISGDRSGLDADSVAAVRDAGLSHVLAISGLHTGIVVGCILGLCRRLLLRTRLARSGYDTLRAAACAAAAALALYVALSGGGIAVTRSAIMAAAFLVLLWRGHGGDGFRAMAWAALALSFARPGIAREAGFQLSFAAVAAILLCMPLVARACQEQSRGLRLAITACTLSLVCWWVTTPIVAHYFYRISIPALAVNVVAAPLVAVTVLLGLCAASLLWVLPLLAALLFELAAAVASLVLLVADAAASLPGAGLAVVDPGWPLVVTLSAAPMVLALAWRWRVRVAFGLVCVTVALAAGAAFARYRSDRMDVYFVAVGQGDASVLRLPGGAVMVIDGGPPGRGRSALAPLLRRLQIATIDYMVVTHAQSDHWGGLAELTREFRLGELWQAAGGCEASAYKRFVAGLESAGLRVSAKIRSSMGGPEGWRIRVLSPAAAVGDCGDNDHSLVLVVEFAGIRLLFAGDIERRGEARLLASGQSLAARVLKVPHHGSRSSSSMAFVEAVRPSIAVASVGFLNRYGFPDPEVARRYSAVGARLFRSDRDGAVHLVVDATGVRATAAK